MNRVLFVDQRNNGQSQIAEAFFNQHASGKARAFSAGMHYTTYIDPTLTQAMKEVGLDLGNKQPKVTTPELVMLADRIISIGCGKASICPSIFVTGEEWEVENPVGKPIEKVRMIRDELKDRVLKLIHETYPQTLKDCPELSGLITTVTHVEVSTS